MPAAAAVDEEIDGKVEKVKELEQLLPGKLAASAFDAGADQVVDDGLDTEHVCGQVEQDGETAQYEQHAGRAELRVAAGQSCGRVLMWLNRTQSAAVMMLQRGRRHRHWRPPALQSL